MAFQIPDSASKDFTFKCSLPSTRAPHVASPRVAPDSTPTRRNIARRASPQTGSHTTPSLPHSMSESVLRSEHPITPDGLRPPLSKKSKSTPDTSLAGGGVIDDSPLPSPSLGGKNYQCTICLSSFVHQGKYFRHQKEPSEKCRRILEITAAKTVRRSDSDSGNVSPASHVGSRPTEGLRDEAASPIGSAASGCLTTPVRGSGCDQGHRSGSPSSERRTPTPGQSTRAKAPAVGKKSPEAESSSTADRKLRTKPVKITEGYVQSTKKGGTPLDLEDNSYPDGDPTPESPPKTQIGLKIHHKLQQKLTSELSPKDGRGEVYVFSDPERPHLCKIGRAKNAESRIPGIRYSCGLEIKSEFCIKVDNYIRTEYMIHAYLTDLCRPYDCDTCYKKHGEWFEIPVETAKATVKIWANFMNKETPYDASKNLQQFFFHRIALVRNISSDLTVEAMKHEWRSIVSPTLVDRARYYALVLGAIEMTFYWQVNAMVAWTWAFIAMQHRVVFVCMTASVVWAFATMAYESHYLRAVRASSKKEHA